MAISLIKKPVNEGLSMNIESVARAEMQADEVLLASFSKGFKEGVMSFIEKRKPDFEGV